MNKKQLIVALLISILIVGCNYSKSKAKETSKEVTGQEETVDFEAADLVGYDGKAVQRQVDKVVDKYDERQKELEKIMGTE